MFIIRQALVSLKSIMKSLLKEWQQAEKNSEFKIFAKLKEKLKFLQVAVFFNFSRPAFFCFGSKTKKTEEFSLLLFFIQFCFHWRFQLLPHRPLTGLRV